MVAPLPGSSPSYLHDTWTDLALDHDQQVRCGLRGGKQGVCLQQLLLWGDKQNSENNRLTSRALPLPSFSCMLLLLLLQVRVAVARQLHAMAQHVAPSDAARLLRRPLAALLRDSSPQVREALLAGLADTLQVTGVWVGRLGPTGVDKGGVAR